MVISRLTRVAFALAIASASSSCDSPIAPEPNTSIGLRVWAEVIPTTLSISDTAARIRVRVYAQNPTSDSLSIISGGPPYIFTSDPTRSQGLEQGFRIASATDSLNAGPYRDYWGQPVYKFGPREGTYTEAVLGVRDWLAGGWSLAPGTLTVRAYFNGKEGSSVSLHVIP
jgi:hypothetical protein